jgi:hypothetical protein
VRSPDHNREFFILLQKAGQSEERVTGIIRLIAHFIADEYIASIHDTVNFQE